MPEKPDNEDAVRHHIRVVKAEDSACHSCGVVDDIFEVRLPVKNFMICPRCFWEMKIQIRDLTTTRIKP